MYCSASNWIEASTSSAVAAGSTTRFTITEWPETPVATPLALNFPTIMRRLIESATPGASIIAPSTTASGPRDSEAKPVTWKPFLDFESSNSFTELEPMSNPTTGFVFFKSCIRRYLSSSLTESDLDLDRLHKSFRSEVRHSFTLLLHPPVQ